MKLYQRIKDCFVKTEEKKEFEDKYPQYVDYIVAAIEKGLSIKTIPNGTGKWVKINVRTDRMEDHINNLLPRSIAAQGRPRNSWDVPKDQLLRALMSKEEFYVTFNYNDGKTNSVVFSKNERLIDPYFRRAINNILTGENNE